MYKKRFSGWLKHLDFIIVDLLCMQLAYIIAYFIRFGFKNPYCDAEYLSLAIVFLLADVVVAISLDSFKNVLKRGWYNEFICVIKHVFFVEAIVLFYLFTTQDTSIYSRISFYVMIPLYIDISYIVRCLWKLQLRKRAARDSKIHTVIIVAPHDKFKEYLNIVVGKNFSAYRCVGFVAIDDNCTKKSVKGIPVVCEYKELANYVCREWVDEIFIFTDKKEDYPFELTEQLGQMGIVTHTAIARSKSSSDTKQFVEEMNGYLFMTHTMNYASPMQLFLKRCMDIAGGLFGSLIALLIIIVVGPIIYIASPGPIIFAQERIGRNGRHFKMYKLRSMYLDAEERKKELMSQNKIGDGMMFKMDFDPRIIGNKILPDGTHKTGIGQFIRKTSLDEFPQFFNILKGDMSLVGTRPPTLDEWEKYEPHHRARMAFRPGLTGLWQVSGRSNITDFEEVVKLDTEYIDNWSIGQDVKIIIKTALSVIKNDGAV